MVKPAGSPYHSTGLTENFSSFEKNRRESAMKTSPASESSVASRKNDQWNMKRDIPVGTVRNNPFLPAPKQQPPQLKYQKKQWDTSNIPKGSVAARIQESDSPRTLIGGNKPISPSKVKGGSNGRPKMFSNSPSSVNNSHSKEPTVSRTNSPRGFYPKGSTSSWQKQQKFFATSPDQNPTQRLSSNRSDEKIEKVVSNRGWQPSKEIPSGTVKGRVSSFFGGESTSKGRKSKDIPTAVSSAHTNKIEYNSSAETSPKNDNSIFKDESLNDEEDQWIIPERNAANTQVFASDWGEAIPAKSAESDDWETPAKEWMRSGESQTDVLSSRDEKEKVTGNHSSFPTEIAAPMPDDMIPKVGNGSLHKPGDHSEPRTTTPSILAPPPKDAISYHKPKERSFSNQKSGDDMAFPARSDSSSLSKAFSDNFEKFDTKSEMILIESSTVGNRFPANDKNSQQLLIGSSDAFGFPVSPTPEIVENRNVGEVIGGDEFFDASVLPNDYGQPIGDDLGFDLNQSQSMTSTVVVEDEPSNGTKEFNSGKGDSKKKRKGFLKGLFGRKSKGDGKVKETTKDSKKLNIRKERSYRKTSLSDSVTNSSGVSFPNSTNSQALLSRSNVEDSVESKQIKRVQGAPTIKTILDHSMGENVISQNETTVTDSKSTNAFNEAFEERKSATKLSMLGDISESKARSSLSGDDVFDDLEPDIPQSQNVTKKTVGSMFLDPALDHLDSNTMSDEESNGGTTERASTSTLVLPSQSPKQSNSFHFSSSDEKLTETRQDKEKRRSTKNDDDEKIVRDGKSKVETSSLGFHSVLEVGESQAEVGGSKAFLIPDRSMENAVSPKTNTKLSGDYEKKSLKEATAQPSKPSQRKESTYGRHNRSSRNGTEYQNAQTNMNFYFHSGDQDGANSKKFSRAAHAYNRVMKKNTSEDSEDQRKYLSIPAASTSASDISCSSTYENYQKKLSESLRKANIATKKSSEYSLHSHKSLDDSSIESDIRVLRSILRRPRLQRDNQRVITASRQIERFPTYDTESATDPMQRVGLRLLASAIIPIQTEVRRFLAMRHALTRMWALIVVQTYTRRFLARKKYQKALNSTITIQAAVRGHLARNYVIDRHICAIEIQRFVRGYLATMQVYEDIYKVTLVQSLVRMRIAMDYAAYRMSLIIQVQAIARGFLTRRRHAHLDKCATLIQSSWRCFNNRLNYQFDLLDIIIVQSLWRKKLGIRTAERKVQERRNIAATLIQSEWRAYDCRMDFLCYIAARTIQTKWRSHSCRMKYIDNQSSIVIQSAARMFLCRLQYIEYQAAMVIQSLARMYFCRLDYADYQSATKIQSVVRMFLCRSQYVEYQCASKIQSVGRMYLCRYDYLEYKAARVLQSAVRMFLCRSGYVEYQAATTIQAAWRCHDCRMDYVFYVSSRKLQSVARMYLCRIKYINHLEETASRVIQTKWRAYSCKKMYIENSAAITIQAKWRSYDCSSMYKRYRSARTIQKMWRSYDCQMNFLHFLADILIVQSTIRRFLAQRRVKAMKNHAATVIQRYWRGFVCFADYEEFKAARKIQSAWRGLICYIDYQEYLTVRKIQSAWRGYACRRDYKREKAAILIQSTWRGFLFYADYMFELSDIVVVQKQIRGWLAKRVANRKRIAMHSSIQMQAQIRGYLQRKEFLSKQAAVIAIQRAWRNVQAMKWTSQMSVVQEITNLSKEVAEKQSGAAIKLQQVFRGSLCRNALKVYFASVLIQSHVRGKQARVAVGLYIAARKIQAVWRAFTPRQSYITYISARKIQAAWRSYIPRQDFVTFLAARCIQNSWRCKKANQNASMLRKEYNAAVLIQSLWRGFVSYTDFVFTLSDIVAAQKFARGYLSRKKYHGVIRSSIDEMKGRWNAAVAIQRTFRGFQARQNYWYTLGCTMQIQSWWRGRRVYLSIQKEANAILTLQCFARCSLARQEYMQRRFVLMLIQTAELERHKKIRAAKMKEQVQGDIEHHQQADQLVLATKRRKQWREEMKKEKCTDNVEEALLEDVWIGLNPHSNVVEEPFTRHYTNFGTAKGSNANSFSQITESTMASTPHPTSSIRMIRKVDAIDMDDDFQLEEAFIDAEICHAKQRRYNAGGYPHPRSSWGATESSKRNKKIISGRKKSGLSIGGQENKSKGNASEVGKAKFNILTMSNH